MGQSGVTVTGFGETSPTPTPPRKGRGFRRHSIRNARNGEPFTSGTGTSHANVSPRARRL